MCLRKHCIVLVIDDKGQVVPNTDIPVKFKITGNGELEGTGSANPSEMESFRQPEHHTFRGKCLVILRPKGAVGNITLEASASGLISAKTVISTE